MNKDQFETARYQFETARYGVQIGDMSMDGTPRRGYLVVNKATLVVEGEGTIEWQAYRFAQQLQEQWDQLMAELADVPKLPKEFH